jgi:hypothetical protein
MKEKDKYETSKLIKKIVKGRFDEYQKDIYGLDVKSKLEEKIPNEEEIKILSNTKGLRSKIFQLLNIKNNIQQFEICFQYIENGFNEIEWDDYENLITNQDYSELEEILYECFRVGYNFNNLDGFGNICYHPDFKLTLKLETDTENQLVDKDDVGYYCIEYEITDEGVFEIEFGSTRKFWDSLNESTN